MNCSACHVSQRIGGGTDRVTMDRFSYLYHQDYGSPKIGEASVPIDQAVLSDDRRELLLSFLAKEGDIHRIDLAVLRGPGDRDLEGKTLHYQVSQLP